MGEMMKLEAYPEVRFIQNCVPAINYTEESRISAASSKTKVFTVP
jgi:hypothetical protein